MKFKWFLVANIIIANNRSYHTHSKLPKFIEKVSNGWGGFKNFSTNQFTNTLFNFNKSMDPKIDIAAISNKDKYFIENMEYLIEKITGHGQINQDNVGNKQTINNINIEDSDDEFQDAYSDFDHIKNQEPKEIIKSEDSDDEFKDAYSDFDHIKNQDSKEESTRRNNSNGNIFKTSSIKRMVQDVMKAGTFFLLIEQAKGAHLNSDNFSSLSSYNNIYQNNSTQLSTYNPASFLIHNSGISIDLQFNYSLSIDCYFPKSKQSSKIVYIHNIIPQKHSTSLVRYQHKPQLLDLAPMVSENPLQIQNANQNNSLDTNTNEIVNYYSNDLLKTLNLSCYSINYSPNQITVSCFDSLSLKCLLTINPDLRQYLPQMLQYYDIFQDAIHKKFVQLYKQINPLNNKQSIYMDVYSLLMGYSNVDLTRTNRYDSRINDGVIVVFNELNLFNNGTDGNSSSLNQTIPIDNNQKILFNNGTYSNSSSLNQTIPIDNNQTIVFNNEKYSNCSSLNQTSPFKQPSSDGKYENYSEETNNTNRNFNWFNKFRYALLALYGLNHLNVFKLNHGQKSLLQGLIVGTVTGYRAGVTHWILSLTKFEHSRNKKLKDSSNINSPDKDFLPFLGSLFVIKRFVEILAPGYISLSIFQAFVPIVIEYLKNSAHNSETMKKIIDTKTLKSVMELYSNSNYGVDQIYQIMDSLKKGQFPGSQLANIYTVVLYEQIPYIGQILKFIKIDKNNTYFLTKYINRILIHKDKIDEDSSLNKFIDGLWFFHEKNVLDFVSMVFPNSKNYLDLLGFQGSLNELATNLGELIPQNDLIEYSIALGDKGKAMEAEEIQKRKEEKQRKTSNSTYEFTSPSPQTLFHCISGPTAVLALKENITKSFEGKKQRNKKTLVSEFKNTIREFPRTMERAIPTLQRMREVLWKKDQ
jgi:hypothetical protein